MILNRLSVTGLLRLSQFSFLLGLAVFLVQSFSQTITYYQTGEEFNGPYPSWKNVKTDYGAKGDNSTDDAAAINLGVNALKNTQSNNYSVLYFPAGTYVINSTIINTGRSAGDEYSGMQIIGEDPARTVIKWNGATNGVMFKLDGWNMKLSRLAFDGNSKAGTGVMRGDGFGTGMEMSDLIFTDFPFVAKDAQLAAISMNSSTSQGQAETVFLRCKFIRCALGINANNQNSLDLWVWDCLFQDCGKGNQSGGFQFYNNVFIGSTVWDIAGNSWQPEAMVNNISINSADFFSPIEVGPWYVQNNKIYHCAKSYTTPSIYSPWANGAVWINNTISATAPASVELPATPPKVARKVFEVTTAASIQTQILAAYNEPAGSKPIVHIPKGTYTVSSTISVPGNKEITIVGDGSGGYGTNVQGGSPTIRLMAPSRATIQDISFDGNPAMLVEVTDQPGSRVLGKLFYAQGRDASKLASQSLIVDSIEHSNLLFLASGIQNCNAGVIVRGGPLLGAGSATNGQVAFLGGAQSHGRALWDVQNGGKAIAQGFWFEADITSTAKHLLELTSNSRGSLTLAAMFWCHKNTTDNIITSIDNFNGVYTALSHCYVRYADPLGIKVSGNGQNCNVLQGYTRFYDGGTVAQNWLDQSSPDANAAFISNGTSNVWKKSVGATPDTASMGKFLALTRNLKIEKQEPCPAGVNDVKLYRVVAASNGGVAARFLAKGPVGVKDNQQSFLRSGFDVNGSAQTIISLGKAVRIPAETKRITVYNMQGRVIWNKVITNESDIRLATNRIESIRKQGIGLVNFIK